MGKFLCYRTGYRGKFLLYPTGYIGKFPLYPIAFSGIFPTNPKGYKGKFHLHLTGKIPALFSRTEGNIQATHQSQSKATFKDCMTAQKACESPTATQKHFIIFLSSTDKCKLTVNGVNKTQDRKADYHPLTFH